MLQLKKYGILLVIIFFFLSIIFGFITAVRFFDNENFVLLKNEYEFYATFDTNVNLVYKGENF